MFQSQASQTFEFSQCLQKRIGQIAIGDRQVLNFGQKRQRIDGLIGQFTTIEFDVLQISYSRRCFNHGWRNIYSHKFHGSQRVDCDHISKVCFRPFPVLAEHNPVSDARKIDPCRIVNKNLIATDHDDLLLDPEPNDLPVGGDLLHRQSCGCHIGFSRSFLDCLFPQR